MKKLFVVLIMTLLLGIIGCSNKNIEKSISQTKSITITREKFDKVEEMKDRLQGNHTGIFKVRNLENGKYKVVILMEEYNNGKLKQSRALLNNEVEIKDNNDRLYVGVNKNEYDLTIDINHINGELSNSATSGKISLDFDKENGHSWSMLENPNGEVHKMKLDKEISIASFSVGTDNTTYGINVGEGARKPSEYNLDGVANSKDIVLYLKISKAK